MARMGKILLKINFHLPNIRLTFQEILDKDKSVSIHSCNLQTLSVKYSKLLKDSLQTHWKKKKLTATYTSFQIWEWLYWILFIMELKFCFFWAKNLYIYGVRSASLLTSYFVYYCYNYHVFIINTIFYSYFGIVDWD